MQVGYWHLLCACVSDKNDHLFSRCAIRQICWTVPRNDPYVSLLFQVSVHWVLKVDFKNMLAELFLWHEVQRSREATIVTAIVLFNSLLPVLSFSFPS